VTGMSSSHDSSQVHINLDESITHHLNELTLDAFQREVATNFLSNEFIDVFTQYCDDNYSSGVCDWQVLSAYHPNNKSTLTMPYC
jgi:hypothetical protein